MQLTHLLPYTSYTLVSYTFGFFLHIKRTYTLVSYTLSPDLHIMSTYTLVSYTLSPDLHIKSTYTWATYTSLSCLHIILCLRLKTEFIYLHILAQLNEYS